MKRISQIIALIILVIAQGSFANLNVDVSIIEEGVPISDSFTIKNHQEDNFILLGLQENRVYTITFNTNLFQIPEVQEGANGVLSIVALDEGRTVKITTKASFLDGIPTILFRFVNDTGIDVDVTRQVLIERLEAPENADDFGAMDDWYDDTNYIPGPFSYVWYPTGQTFAAEKVKVALEALRDELEIALARAEAEIKVVADKAAAKVRELAATSLRETADNIAAQARALHDETLKIAADKLAARADRLVNIEVKNMADVVAEEARALHERELKKAADDVARAAVKAAIDVARAATKTADVVANAFKGIF